MIDGEHFSGSNECRDDWSNHESRGALKARADEAKDEVARLRDVVETYDERFASQHDEHKAEVERLEALVAAKNERLSEADTEVERLRGVLSDFAEADCEYGDGCPDFGSRHYRCTGCIARAALAEEGER